MTTTDYSYVKPANDEMLSRLLTVDAARERLAPTEGLAEYEFATDGESNKVRFNFPDNWNAGLKEAPEYHVTTATMDLDGTEIPLTKNGALEIASAVSLSEAAMNDTPGGIIEPYLNHWYSHGARGKKSLKILAGNSGALALTRGTITPFSSTRLLDAIVAGISERFGTDDVLVDYKLEHSLKNTNLRIVLPSATRNIGSARAAKAGEDPWSLGIQLTNSIEGKSSLELQGYLFAWWCTNGSTIERASSGKYRRKPSLTPDDAYEWAQAVTADVFNDLDSEFDAIEQLTQIPLEGELNETVGRMFERFRVPTNTRESIINNLVESDDLSAYGLMNAVTQAANNPELSANAVNDLLRAGGDVAHVLSDRCNVCHRF